MATMETENEKEMSYGGDYKFLPATSVRSGRGVEVRPDLYCYTVQIVNVCMIGHPQTKDFVLVDAGTPKSANEIIAAAEKRFGAAARPKAIVLTHGHFDHVGAVIELVKHWNVPVYAHELELPFLTGQVSYPQPKPSFDGGLVLLLSPMFPNEPINLGNHVHKLPLDGTIPFLSDISGFRWIHTPGHTPGHISLFREEDRTLIAGDSFVTVKQDSVYKVFTQELEISGPPKYLTQDWKVAWESIKKMAELKPNVAVTSHGKPMSGEMLANSLQELIDNFDQIAVPAKERMQFYAQVYSKKQ